MIISRQVHDPRMTFLPKNKMARTIGIYGHLPKYWKCHDYNFDGYWKMATSSMSFELNGEKYTMGPTMTNPDEIEWHKQSAERRRSKHMLCKKNKRHRSNVGYLRFVGPKKTTTFWYMGNPYRHKLFERGNSRTIIFRGKIINDREMRLD